MSASPQALAAVRAIKMRHVWGPFAACRYAEKRGASATMIFIAHRFEVSRKS